MRIIEIKPVAISVRTNSTLNDPGITYNESGVTYNDPLYVYGGISGQQDVIPAFVLARDVKPTIAFVGQQWSEGANVILYQGMPLGPGFFLYITYPEQGTITT